MSPLQEAKLWLVAELGLAKDALHIYVGLGLFLGSALLFRWPLSRWKPLILVALAALAGEVWDLIDSRRLGTRIDLSANWKDVWNTLFWPVALFVIARFGWLRSDPHVHRVDDQPDQPADQSAVDADILQVTPDR